MKKIKNIIFVLVLILVLILLAILILSKKDEEDVYDYSEDSLLVENEENEIDEKIAYEDDRNVFYLVNSIVTKFINSVNLDESDIVMSLLDENFINEYNIIEKDIKDIMELNNLVNSDYYYEYKSSKILKSERKTTNIYFVYGKYIELDTDVSHEYKIMLEIDFKNYTYNIYSYKYMEKNGYDKLEIGDFVNIETTEIENRTYNIFEYSSYSEIDVVNDYFDTLRWNLLYDTEDTYNLLDEEYAGKRFGDIKKFKAYVQENKIDIFTMEIDKYQVNNYNDYTQYICIDTKGNYYIFNETSVMQYTIMLDTYTADIPQFVEQYNKSTTQEKVALNINKFIQGINDESYYYTYNLLADSFKNNYYKTQEEYEKYIKENLFTENEIEYVEYSEEGTTYIYEIQLSDATGESSEIKNMTVIMQLKEETDFIMSFSIK